MFKGILFDLGSTLLEFDNTDWGVLEHKCLRRGYDFLAQRHQLPEWEEFTENFLTKFHLAWMEADVTFIEIRFAEWASNFLREQGIETPDGLGRKFLDRYYQPIFQQISLIEKAPDVLAEFKSMGLKIGLVSNSSFPSEYHLKEMELFRLKRYFDFIIFSHDFGYRKPHTGLFNHALSELALSPQETVFVGDRLREDVAGSQGAGMKAILKFKPGRDYSYQITPDALIHHLSELPQVLKKIY